MIANFLNNAFELGSGTVFTDWVNFTDGGGLVLEERAHMRTGRRAVMLHPGVAGGSARADVSQAGITGIITGRTYRITAWVRGVEPEAVTMRFSLHNDTTNYFRHANGTSWLAGPAGDRYDGNESIVLAVDTVFQRVSWEVTINENGAAPHSLSDIWSVYFMCTGVGTSSSNIIIDSVSFAEVADTRSLFTGIVVADGAPAGLSAGGGVVKAHYVFDTLQARNVQPLVRVGKQRDALAGYEAFEDLEPQGNVSALVYRQRTAPYMLQPYSVRLDGVSNFFEVPQASQVGLDMRLNLDNPDFEIGSGSDFSPWSDQTSGTGSVTEEGVLTHTGSRAVRLSAGTGSAAILQVVSAPVRQREQYVVSVWARGSVGGETLKIAIRNGSTDTQYIPGSPPQWASIPVGNSLDSANVFEFVLGTTYQRYVVEWESNDPNGAVAEDDLFRMIFANAGSGETLFVDDAQLAQNLTIMGFAKTVQGLSLTSGITPPLVTKKALGGSGYVLGYTPASSRLAAQVTDERLVTVQALSPSGSYEQGKWQGFALRLDYTASTTGQLTAGCGTAGLGPPTALPSGQPFGSPSSVCPFRLGTNESKTSFLDGSLAEVIVVKGALSDDAIERYMSSVA